jgi:multisubunit Na+/H+ antiporter MnhE subunit
MIAFLVQLIIGLVVLAIILWIIAQFAPAELHQLLRLIAFAAFLIWVLVTIVPPAMQAVR